MFSGIIILQSILIAISVFSIYLIYNKSEHTKEVKLFLMMLAIFTAVYMFDLAIILHSGKSRYEVGSPLNYTYILTGVTSQLYTHFFVYRMIFTARSTFKIICRLAFPAILIIAGLWIADTFGAIDRLHSFRSMSEVRDNIGSPVVIARLLLLLLQFIYALNIIVVAYRLLPLYQQYIDKNESNMTHNISWIKRVCELYMLTSLVYFINAIFHTELTFIICLATVIIPFSKMISLVIDHSNIEGLDELYDRLGIKWSLKKMWHIDDIQTEHNVGSLMDFKAIDQWIMSETPYTNPDFSFKDIAERYPNMSYNEFDYTLQQEKRCNFQSYIRGCRIERAKSIMSHKGKDIRLKEVAFEVGFESLSSFSRAFKASTAMTPSEWRANHRAISTPSIAK